MQIASINNAAAQGPVVRSLDTGFRPIANEDLTLRGIMRRMSDINLGNKVDIQA